MNSQDSRINYTPSQIKEVKIYTPTELSIMEKKALGGAKEDRVFTAVKLKVYAEVVKSCGQRAATLYLALLATHRLSRESSYKLPETLKSVIGLGKCDRSEATKKLEEHGYIEVERNPGCKNRYSLTKKGLEGLPDFK